MRQLLAVVVSAAAGGEEKHGQQCPAIGEAATPGPGRRLGPTGSRDSQGSRAGTTNLPAMHRQSCTSPAGPAVATRPHSSRPSRCTGLRSSQGAGQRPRGQVGVPDLDSPLLLVSARTFKTDLPGPAADRTRPRMWPELTRAIPSRRAWPDVAAGPAGGAPDDR